MSDGERAALRSYTYVGMRVDKSSAIQLRRLSSLPAMVLKFEQAATDAWFYTPDGQRQILSLRSRAEISLTPDQLRELAARIEEGAE